MTSTEPGKRYKQNFRAEFLTSSTRLPDCPRPDKPEFAFIGRSNVGKSSIINMITGVNGLARVSATPGKTRTINHFLIDGSWYIADLPGYGYARVSKSMREDFIKFIDSYLTKRENLLCLFVLIDIRHEALRQDMEFMESLAMKQIPFARVFTKSDKISANILSSNVAKHNKAMMMKWESLPPTFITSAKSGLGREELLSFIEETSALFRR